MRNKQIRVPGSKCRDEMSVYTVLSGIYSKAFIVLAWKREGSRGVGEYICSHLTPYAFESPHSPPPPPLPRRYNPFHVTLTGQGRPDFATMTACPFEGVLSSIQLPMNHISPHYRPQPITHFVPKTSHSHVRTRLADGYPVKQKTWLSIHHTYSSCTRSNNAKSKQNTNPPTLSPNSQHLPFPHPSTKPV